MQEDTQEFVKQWIIRDRPIVALKPGSPGLSERERREWWEFCLWMVEFLGNILEKQLVPRDQAQHLSRLHWIFFRGTYLFSIYDPVLRGEQKRFVELCVISGGAVFPWIVDPEGIFEDDSGRAAWNEVFGSSAPSRWAAQGTALLRSWVLWEKSWEHADSPIAWLRSVAMYMHITDAEGGWIPVSDALYKTPEKQRDHTDASLTFGYRERARDTLPLEDVAEMDGAAELGLSRRTWMSVAALEAAVQDDEDLRQYMELRIKSWKPSAAWAHLGWDAARGRATDRRFRRLREKIKTSGFEHQTRDIELSPGSSHANCTVTKERFRFAVSPNSEATLSGRVVYDPRLGGERFDRND